MPSEVVSRNSEFNTSATSCALVVARVFLRHVCQCFPSFKVVKIPVSLLIDFLNESDSEQVTLKLFDNPVLVGGLVVISHVELITVIVC